MQIQNQLGRDDTIDPYYLTRLRGNRNSSSTNLRYTIEKKIGSNGEIYYQLIEMNELGSRVAGANLSLVANEILYEDSNSVKVVLDNLIRRDLEVQEILENISSSSIQNQMTFEELHINIENASIQDIVEEVISSEINSQTLVVGTLGETALPSEISTADVEIKKKQIGENTYYEISAYSDYKAPYKWTTLYKDNEMLLDWTEAYNGGSDMTTISELQNTLTSHIENANVHVSSEERQTWNNHVNVSINTVDGTLIFKH